MVMMMVDVDEISSNKVDVSTVDLDVAQSLAEGSKETVRLNINVV
jgi:hypothetical protein